MSALVQIAGVSQSYTKRPVLRDVGFTVQPGRIVGLLGPNGCGKTTLIKILAGLIHCYTGTVEIDGHAPGVYTKGIVSYLPESTYLNSWMKAGAALDMFADYYSDFDRSKAEEMMRRFGLEPGMKLKIMSKGMQEKLQLILVMCRDVKLYLLDEPLGGVDPATRSTILDVILQSYTEDASLLISTHLIHDVERIFDSVIILDQGAVRINDTVDNIRQQHQKSVDEVFREVFRC